MRMSKAITLSLLGLGTAGLAGGCAPEPTPPPSPPLDFNPPADSTPTDPAEVAIVADETWHDAHGNKIPEEWTEDVTGKQVPVTHPHDKYGRKWVYDSEGHLVPPPTTTARTTSIFGGIVFLPIPGGRPGGAVVHRSTLPHSSTIPRSGFGTTGRITGPSAT